VKNVFPLFYLALPCRYLSDKWIKKDGTMRQNEQNQQGSADLPEAVEQPVLEGEVLSAADLDEEAQQLRGEQQEVEANEGEQQLREAQQKADEYLDLLRRTQADFVNYRRRTVQEQAEARTTAQVALLNQLLPVLDDFERALEATPPDLGKHPWVQGLFLVARRLTTLLDQLGVQQIGTCGEQFDPRQHEAISMEASADVPEGSIVQVVRPGYVLGERIIRPAQVIVASAPEPVRDSSPY